MVPILSESCEPKAPVLSLTGVDNWLQQPIMWVRFPQSSLVVAQTEDYMPNLILEDDAEKLKSLVVNHFDVLGVDWTAHFREVLPAQRLCQLMPTEEWTIFLDNEVIGCSSGMDFLQWCLLFMIKIKKVWLTTNSLLVRPEMIKLCEDHNIPWELSCVCF